MLRDTNIDRELQEARAEAQNGLRREPGSDDGDLSNDLAIARAAKNGWERPIDFHQWDLPRFTTDALPDWWRSCVEATAVATQTPVDMPAVLSLAAVAACVQGRVRIEVRPGYVEPFNLYVTCVMEPGNRKSAVQRIVTAPIERYEREESERLAPEVEAVRTQRQIDEKRLERARDAAAKCDTQERRELEEEAKQLAADLAKRPHLNAPRLLADDVTPEQLATLMVENNSRMAVLSAEGTIFELMLGRYDKNGAPNLDLFLKSHSGDPLRVDRKNRGSEHVSDPALTLGLAVQPEVIRGLISNTALRGRGLLARFLYSIPAGFVGARDVDPPPLRSEIEQAYGNALTEMLARNIDPVAVIRLSEAARRTWLEFSERTERRLGTDGDFHLIREWAGKLPGAVARIAAVLHVASHFGGDWDQPLAAGTMAQAVRIGDYFSAHALAAFSEMGADPAIENVRALLRWLQRSGVEKFSKRDAFNAHRARFRRVQAMDPALELLRQHGWVRFAETDATGGRGRPVSPVFEVNPLLPFLTHKSHKAQKSDSAATAISASMRPR